jgi:hypothetical protein
MGLSDVISIRPRPYTEVSPRMTTPSEQLYREILLTRGKEALK